MNRYIVYVTGSDSLGFGFIKNVVTLANKGAVLQEDKVPNMRFPHSAFMFLETEEVLEDSPGIRYQIIREVYTKEQLDDMSWDDFKKVCKKQFGLSGRDRNLLSSQYLKLAFGDEESSKEEK